MAQHRMLDELATPHVPDGADDATRLAAEAWGGIARLFLSQQDRREEVAAELGLHVSDLISLFHLDPSQGVSQRDLATAWTCDPSWVTNRVDRLEELGLVERRVVPTDRRVKQVWLTEAGRTHRATGMVGFHRPPEAFGTLTLAELEALAAILERLAPGHPPEADTATS